MLLLSYIIMPLKQLFRLRVAFFFTLIFPVVLYLIYGHTGHPLALVTFINFAMQSAMLQTVGIFVAVQKHTAWGKYITTLPAPNIYPILGTLISMFMLGITGILSILLIDSLFFHVLSSTNILCILFATTIGAMPMGTLGYLIGLSFDAITAKSILTLVNLAFLFITIVPASIQNVLAYFSLPNTWLAFTLKLVAENTFSWYYILILAAYTIIFLLLSYLFMMPKRQYSY